MTPARNQKLEARITALTERLSQAKARKLLSDRAAIAREKMRRRREMTRRKIELGGLVVVAGLADLDAAELAGWLFVCSDQRKRDPASHERVRQIGAVRLAERARERRGKRIKSI